VKKVKNRALCVLLLVAVGILGVGFFVVRLAVLGDKWASAPFNTTVYRGGVLSSGTLTDRNGVLLAGVSEGKRKFADSADVRRSTLHAVGDLNGNIGTGALTVYAPKLMGYNFFTGAYSRAGLGKTVALTLDSRLNVEAYKALNGRRGAVMVMNYKTGEVLCMVSRPAFDPGDPPKNVDSDPAYDGVYLNRAISASYTPGSTFKLLTAAAAIENIEDLSQRKFRCEGSFETERGKVTCSKTHGTITFEEALTASCNCAFGELAIELGADILAGYAKDYGLSERTKVGGITTAKGNFEKARPGTANLAWSGIGQYNNTVCPASMLRYVGAIANDGVAVDMSLTQRTGLAAVFPGGSKRIMRSDTARQLEDLMDYSVHMPATAKNFPGLQLHAKSGTAEVGDGKKPHAWFAGFITNEDHPLAFVVVVENGGGGLAEAGPVANRVLKVAISG